MRVLATLMAIGIASLSPARAQTIPIATERFGLYVVSDDLARAAAFYQRLFGKPQVRVPGMVGFDVAGGLYAVVDRKTFAVSAIRGDSTRGYLKVVDLRATYEIVVAVAPSNIEDRPKKEGRFSFFRIRDPDGNLIEFYEVGAKQ